MSQYDGASLILPISVVTRADLARLVNDIEQLDANLTTADIKEESDQAVLADNMTDQARALFEQNSLDHRDALLRSQVIKALRQLKVKAPVFYLRFASEVDSSEQQQLADWFRQSIDQHSLLDFRVQPAVIGGVYLRSKNRVFDLSWRQRFADSRKIIAKTTKELAR